MTLRTPMRGYNRVLAFVSSAVGLRGGGASCTAYYKDALYAAVLDNTPAVGFVEETENEFENGNEEHGAG